MNKKSNFCCWLCNSRCLFLVKKNNSKKVISAASFKITDLDYGITLDIYKCKDCGFMQCPDSGNLVAYYRNMSDPQYEDSSDSRAIQSRNIIKLFNTKLKIKNKTLFDIGAGSGILILEAEKLGVIASGIEPSTSLAKIANNKGADVYCGTLPLMNIKNKYDLITMIDVIEHVNNPIRLLKEASKIMHKKSIGILVTPDRSSFVAKLLGWKWWHYRVAHVGYFNNSNLHLALKSAGLKIVSKTRPTWYFPLDYLFIRAMRYLPKSLRLTPPNFLKNCTIPLNLRDSTCVIFQRENNRS